MQRFVNLVLGTVFVLLVSACDRMQPAEIAIAKYPEIAELLVEQSDVLIGKSLQKEVWLEDDSEMFTLEMDTAAWERELAFLEEINPNQPEYVGAFEEVESESQLVLSLGEKERGVLKKLVFESKGERYLLKATIHEDKDVYVHHRELELTFLSRRLSSYSIDGYQKIMLKDTVRFRITGKVL